MAEMLDAGTEGVGELEVVQEQIQQEEKAAEVPEKYRGKTVEQIVQMHQATEKTLSRQGQELGEVRKLADELLRAQLAKKAEEKQPEVDFFANPQEAVRQAVDSHPKVIAAEQYAAQSRMAEAQRRLTQSHPDANDIAASEGFQGWIKESPVRIQLFQRADQAYDFDAANELLSTYKQLHAKRQEVEVQADKTTRTQALKAAAVDVGGSGETTKKSYRRGALILLKIRDPAAYAELVDSGELARAYAENRVKN